MCSVAHLHIALCLLACYVFYIHHFHIDVAANSLEVLMRVVVDLDDSLLLESGDPLFFLLLLDGFPHVVADGRPDLLVHQQVLLRGHLRRDLVRERQLRDVLILIEVLLELLELHTLFLNEVSLRHEVVLPLLELADADLFIAKRLPNLVDDFVAHLLLRLEQHVGLPLLPLLQCEHVGVVSRVNAAHLQFDLLEQIF